MSAALRWMINLQSFELEASVSVDVAIFTQLKFKREVNVAVKKENEFPTLHDSASFFPVSLSPLFA